MKWQLKCRFEALCFSKLLVNKGVFCFFFFLFSLCFLLKLTATRWKSWAAPHYIYPSLEEMSVISEQWGCCILLCCSFVALWNTLSQNSLKLYAVLFYKTYTSSKKKNVDFCMAWNSLYLAAILSSSWFYR